MFTGKKQLHYKLIDDETGYWKRRETKNWQGCPDLF